MAEKTEEVRQELRIRIEYTDHFARLQKDGWQLKKGQKKPKVGDVVILTRKS